MHEYFERDHTRGKHLWIMPWKNLKELYTSLGEDAPQLRRPIDRNLCGLKRCPLGKLFVYVDLCKCKCPEFEKEDAGLGTPP